MKRPMLCILAIMLTAAPVAAQETGWDRLFPRVRYFDLVIADPHEPRLSLAMVQSNVFERAGEARELRPEFTFPDPEDAASDVQVMVGVGGTVPLWHLVEWEGKGGIVASAHFGVFSRFRIEYPTREDTGQDWFIGMPIEIAYNKFSGRFRIMHRSSHLGDELVQITNAERIEFGGEYADFLAAYEVRDGARVYGGATWNFRSYTAILPALVFRNRGDTGQLQAGFDARWHPWSEGRVGLIGGLDWQSQQRTNWRSQFGATGGLAIKTPRRSSSLVARYFHGPSIMGEFFLTPETFWSLEWVVEL